MEKNKVIVKIRNREYIIMSADSQEYILSVAAELDSRIKEIAAVNSALNPETLVILASLNLCDEFMKLSETNKALQQQITNTYKDTEVETDTEELEMQFETAKERIKLLEAQLSDDNSQRKEIEKLRRELDGERSSKEEAKAAYEKKISQLKEQFAAKEKEWLDMIDKM